MEYIIIYLRLLRLHLAVGGDGHIHGLEQKADVEDCLAQAQESDRVAKDLVQRGVEYYADCRHGAEQERGGRPQKAQRVNSVLFPPDVQLKHMADLHSRLQVGHGLHYVELDSPQLTAPKSSPCGLPRNLAFKRRQLCSSRSMNILGVV